jgi:hypothetical protein
MTFLQGLSVIMLLFAVVIMLSSTNDILRQIRDRM